MRPSFDRWKAFQHGADCHFLNHQVGQQLTRCTTVKKEEKKEEEGRRRREKRRERSRNWDKVNFRNREVLLYSNTKNSPQVNDKTSTQEKIKDCLYKPAKITQLWKPSDFWTPLVSSASSADKLSLKSQSKIAKMKIMIDSNKAWFSTSNLTGKWVLAKIVLSIWKNLTPLFVRMGSRSISLCWR